MSAHTPELPPLHWVGAMQIDNASFQSLATDFQSLATEASVEARERILLDRIAELEGAYTEILGAVVSTIPNESPHQTAMRYIQEREGVEHFFRTLAAKEQAK